MIIELCLTIKYTQAINHSPSEWIIDRQKQFADKNWGETGCSGIKTLFL